MVKERKIPSLYAQASFAPFSLKVAWSGKSLIMGRGDGYKTGYGGMLSFTPTKKGGGRKSFSHVEAGHKFWGSFNDVA